MTKYLVIVESPAKKKKISDYLNSIPKHTFIVDHQWDMCVVSKKV